MVKAVPSMRLFLAALAMPVLLGGCFAMEKDLDPIRSDVAVLEKQVVDMQGDVSKIKQQVAEGPEAPQTATGIPSDTQSRLAAMEKRLDRLEAQIRDLKQAQGAPAAPQPIAPEPVIIEPMEGTPKAPAPAAPQPGPGPK